MMMTTMQRNHGCGVGEVAHALIDGICDFDKIWEHLLVERKTPVTGTDVSLLVVARRSQVRRYR